jgi:hypothetical protein
LNKVIRDGAKLAEAVDFVSLNHGRSDCQVALSAVSSSASASAA